MRSRMMLVVLFVIHGSVFAGGSKIEVVLRNDAVVKGELLSVREDALVIATKDYTEYTVKPEDQSRIAVLRFEDVKIIETPGSSYTLVGTGVGFLGGLGITAAIMSFQEDTTPIHLIYGSVVLMCGTIAGFVVGELSSTPDVRAVVSPSFDFASLKSHSRYPEGEPEVLQAVQYYSSLK